MGSVQLNILNAQRAGLVRVYFPNGSSFEGWADACQNCRHNLDQLDNPKPGRLTPPYACCGWGVSDRIYEAMASGRYGYGTSFHPPEDVKVENLSPTCLRYTPKSYGDDDRDPPRPDVPGQMMLDESVVPMERITFGKSANAQEPAP